MARKKQPNYDGPTQKTPGGHVIPLPKRSEIMAAFEKVAKPKKKG
jgi:hypothetical protein